MDHVRGIKKLCYEKKKKKNLSVVFIMQVIFPWKNILVLKTPKHLKNTRNFFLFHESFLQTFSCFFNFDLNPIFLRFKFVNAPFFLCFLESDRFLISFVHARPFRNCLSYYETTSILSFIGYEYEIIK